MGKIKKILENELVGGTQRIDIYPVTSTKAVYDEDNERLDNVLNNLKNGIDNCVTLTSEQNITAAKTFSGGISMNNTRIKDVKEPTDLTDATNKSYIDSKVANIPVEKGTGEGSIIQKGSQDYPAIASGRISSAFGMNTKSIGNYSFSEGEDTQALGEHSHVEGFSTTASGSDSHAEGAYTRASGEISHAEGENTEASGYASHAEGYTTKAGGENSHAEGSNTTASGDNSHTEGYKSVASGLNSHAEGYKTAAVNAYSHSEGGNTISNGKGSHAEGYDTLADNNHSHSEGFGTKAYSLGSHAEGYNTKAGLKGSTTGYSYSHAEGHSTEAVAQYSHAEGYHTKTLNESEHAQGYFNKSNSGDTPATKTQHSVGIGSSDTNRKNAFEIMQNGDCYVLGIGGYQGTTISSATPLANFINSIQSDLGVLSSDYDMYKEHIQGQVSELDALARGAQRALVYADYSKLVTALNGMLGVVLPKGQSIYIQQLDVPDLWVSNFRAPDELTEYTYTNDADFLEYIKGGGWIGCHQLSLLETAKVDLSNTASKAEITSLQAEVAALKAIINEITTKE